jgi:hypothetical protein
MNRPYIFTIPIVLLISAIVLYLFIDIANQARDLERERDELMVEVQNVEKRVVELENSLANCTLTAQTLLIDARDFYDKWQTERTIAYAIWQIFDAATNVTWEGAEYTQVNILIPKDQWEYLRNLSEIYGTQYQ